MMVGEGNRYFDMSVMSHFLLLEFSPQVFILSRHLPNECISRMTGIGALLSPYDTSATLSLNGSNLGFAAHYNHTILEFLQLLA